MKKIYFIVFLVMITRCVFGQIDFSAGILSQGGIGSYVYTYEIDSDNYKKDFEPSDKISIYWFEVDIYLGIGIKF